MKSARRRSTGMFTTLALLASLMPGKPFAEEADEVSGIVVKVTGVHGTAHPTGSGIIFGADGGRLLVVTADHLARPGDGATQDLRVQFHPLNASPVPATLLDHHSPEMDVAVLAIAGAREQGIDPARLPLDKLGEIEVLRPSDRIYLLGYPDEGEGRMKLSPDVLTAVSGDRLRTSSNEITEGYSGGALLNQHQEIVGMILSKRHQGGVALAMPKLLETLRSWGYRVALRTRFSTSDLTALSAGRGHSCYLLSNGDAYCWGANLYGRLGSGGDCDSPTPARVEGGVPFVSIATGDLFTCGLARSGIVYCWGSANGDWVGACVKAGSPVPVPIAAGRKFRTLSGGGMRACAITSEGETYCWDNSENAVPCRPEPGSYSRNAWPSKLEKISGTLRFSSLSVGASHVCAVTPSGEAYCWGDNAGGQLGDGTQRNRTEPVRVLGSFQFRSVSAGAGFTCGVSLDGTGYCWGSAGHGRLGDGRIENSTKPVKVTGGHQFAIISAGYWHACGVTRAGKALCWGHDIQVSGALGNDYEQTNEPEPVDSNLIFAAVDAGETHTCGISKSGDVYCWGANGQGQLGTAAGTKQSQMPLRVKVP